MPIRQPLRFVTAAACILAPLPQASAFDLSGLTSQIGGAVQSLQPQTAPPPQTQNGAALAALSQGEVGRGLKAALSRGVDSAVSILGRPDGFNGNPRWRIPLPPGLEKAASAMRMVGMGAQADALTVAINRAAEAAVPQGKALLVSAVRNMSIQDAKGILTGGDQAATDYFRRTTHDALAAAFLPVVHRATVHVGLAQAYDRYAGEAAQFGLVNRDEADIDHYVTEQALNRLYQAIGEQEKAIRADPVGAGSALIAKVFGALRP